MAVALAIDEEDTEADRRPEERPPASTELQALSVANREIAEAQLAERE